MYGCDSKMRCLSGSVTRVGGELFGEVTKIGHELYGSVTRIGKEFCGSVTLVCSVNKEEYLSVVPDVVWLTPDMLSGEFDIYSNVVWKIE